jgi:hypothetical protein
MLTFFSIRSFHLIFWPFYPIFSLSSYSALTLILFFYHTESWGGVSAYMWVYPALSVCISNVYIRLIGAISDWILHDQRWWILTITSDGKSNEFPNTLVCPHIISDFHASFPVTFCYVPKVINTACFPSEIQQVWR